MLFILSVEFMLHRQWFETKIELCKQTMMKLMFALLVSVLTVIHLIEVTQLFPVRKLLVRNFLSVWHREL